MSEEKAILSKEDIIDIFTKLNNDLVKLKIENETYKQEEKKYIRNLNEIRREFFKARSKVTNNNTKNEMYNTILAYKQALQDIKEFIYKCNDGKQGINYSGCSEILDIVNKALGSDK